MWWNNFEGNVRDFYFMFISGHFKGNFEEQLLRISRNKGINGAALAVRSLLLCAEGIKSGRLTHKIIGEILFCNKEYVWQEL